MAILAWDQNIEDYEPPTEREVAAGFRGQSPTGALGEALERAIAAHRARA